MTDGIGSPARPSLAIVSNEFFAPELGRMGGFGWAAREAARAIGTHLDDRLDVVFVSCEHRAGDGWPAEVHGRRLVRCPPDPADWAAALASERIDALLTIDYRPSYAPLMRALPRTPAILWMRDPRSPADLSKLATLRVPGDGAAPQGIREVDCTSLGPVLRRRFPRPRRPVVCASPAPKLAAERAPAAYGLDVVPELLPNPLPPMEPAARTAEPTVAVLGRLDPIKRPWVAVEVARRLPEAQFLLLGRNHFDGPGSWQPSDLPPNVRLLGHLDGGAKRELLQSSWALLNTSIHEGLPISFQEALAAGVPIVALLDPERVVSRFGVYVGEFDGDGLDGIEPLADGLGRLLTDEPLRQRLGAAGRDWAISTHGPERFASTLVRQLRRLDAIDG